MVRALWLNTLILLSLSAYSQQNEFYRYSFDYFVKHSQDSNFKSYLKDKEEGWIFFMPNKINSKLIDQYVDWKLVSKADSTVFGDFSEKGVWYSTKDQEFNQLMQLWNHQYYAPFWEIRMNELGFNKEYVYPSAMKMETLTHIYDFTSEPAEFPGGTDKLYLYLSKALKFSQKVSGPELTVSFKVMVTFIIAKDGTIHNVNVLHAPSIEVSNEIKRVIETMPNWIPARVKGKLVNSTFNLPININ